MEVAHANMATLPLVCAPLAIQRCDVMAEESATVILAVAIAPRWMSMESCGKLSIRQIFVSLLSMLSHVMVMVHIRWLPVSANVMQASTLLIGVLSAWTHGIQQVRAPDTAKAIQSAVAMGSAPTSDHAVAMRIGVDGIAAVVRPTNFQNQQCQHRLRVLNIVSRR